MSSDPLESVPESLWDRLVQRIAKETGAEPLPTPQQTAEPEWEEAANGILVKVLATNHEMHRVSCTRPGLVHDPSDDGASGRVIGRCPSPDVMENVERNFLRRFPIPGDPQRQRENDPVRAFVNRMQRKLIAGGNRFDQPNPFLLCYMSRGGIFIKQIAQGLRIGLIVVHGKILRPPDP